MYLCLYIHVQKERRGGQYTYMYMYACEEALTPNGWGHVSVHVVNDSLQELVGEGEGERGRFITGLPPAHQQHTLEVI